jgi:hypothetical protein
MGVKLGSPILKEGHRLRESEKIVVRIFGSKWNEVTGGWKKTAQ